ncbi:MAG TPA: hypothetical protein VF469_33005 [Kofleriaceae bacterium]
MIGPASPGGRELWSLVPEHTRARDNGDLASYIDALGEVLDLVRGVIQQRVADSFPDHPDLQPWVLPYLADLIDPRVVSSDDARRRLEIASAAGWRKTKGTLRVVEQIAAALGGFGWTDGDPAARPKQPVVVQEGWRRVAVTPRVPLSTPPEVLADRRKLLVDKSLPMGTVDFRFYSRRIVATDGSTWLQANPHGVPCFPGSVEDLSARTPDLRTPTWRTGHAHPSRALIFTVPHAGFFPPGWDLVPIATGDDHGKSGGILVGPQEISSAASEVFTLTDCWLDGTLHIKSGGVRLVRCAIRNVVVDTPEMVDAAAHPTTTPPLSATDCLFESVTSAGLAQLTFCTVLKAFQAPRVWTSDSLFAGSFEVPKPAEPWHKDAEGQYDGTPEDAIRYSRVPPAVLTPELVDAGAGQPQQRRDFRAFRCVGDLPFFVASQFAVAGSGVLLPLSGPAIEAGAEDGGELGAYHHRGYAVHARAVLDKLRDYLPVGQTAVIIPDDKLNFPPPKLKA